MAKNITLMGADYPQVPAVQLPQTGGGTATFYDIDIKTDDVTVNNHAVTKQSAAGAYYSQSEIDVSQSGYTPIACLIYEWSGIFANVVPYITSSNKLGFTSDVSQTFSKVGVRITYIKQ